MLGPDNIARKPKQQDPFAGINEGPSTPLRTRAPCMQLDTNLTGKREEANKRPSPAPSASASATNKKQKLAQVLKTAFPEFETNEVLKTAFMKHTFMDVDGKLYNAAVAAFDEAQKTENQRTAEYEAISQEESAAKEASKTAQQEKAAAAAILETANADLEKAKRAQKLASTAAAAKDIKAKEAAKHSSSLSKSKATTRT